MVICAQTTAAAHHANHVQSSVQPCVDMVAVVNLGEKNKKYVAMSASLARKHAGVIANVKRVISSALNIAVSRGVIRDALEYWNVNTHVQVFVENFVCARHAMK